MVNCGWANGMIVVLRLGTCSYDNCLSLSYLESQNSRSGKEAFCPRRVNNRRQTFPDHQRNLPRMKSHAAIDLSSPLHSVEPGHASFLQKTTEPYSHRMAKSHCLPPSLQPKGANSRRKRQSRRPRRPPLLSSTSLRILVRPTTTSTNRRRPFRPGPMPKIPALVSSRAARDRAIRTTPGAAVPIVVGRDPLSAFRVASGAGASGPAVLLGLRGATWYRGGLVEHPWTGGFMEDCWAGPQALYCCVGHMEWLDSHRRVVQMSRRRMSREEGLAVMSLSLPVCKADARARRRKNGWGRMRL